MSTEVGLLEIPPFNTFSIWSFLPILIHLLPFFPVFVIISGCYHLISYISSKFLLKFLPFLIKHLPTAFTYLINLLEWTKLKLDVILVWFFSEPEKKKRKKKSRNNEVNTSVNEQSIDNLNLNTSVSETTLIEQSTERVANITNKRVFVRYKKIQSYPNFEAAIRAMENKIENQFYVNRYF